MSGYYYRVFLAVPVSTSEGLPTNAVYGFEHAAEAAQGAEPDYVAAVLDCPEPTFRHEVYQDYKAPAEIPMSFQRRVPHMKDVIAAFSIASVEKHEALRPTM